MLPLLLAGPIVRRTSEDSIVLWVATSKKLELYAEAYVESIKTPGIISMVGSSRQVLQLQMGEHLFCQLLELSPTGRSVFPQSQLIYYDIGLSVDRKPQGNFPRLRRSIISASVRDRICFENEKLPSVLLGRSDRPSLRAIYGSCRKAGGVGENPLAIVHNDFERSFRVISRRPTALCLIGDQIYADGTLDVTFSEVIQLSKAIAGSYFTSPLKGMAKLYETPGSRGSLVEERFLSRNLTGFSIDIFKGGNHLIAFHEFSAAYLLSLNSELWARKGGVLDQLNAPIPSRIGAIERGKIGKDRTLAKSYFATVQQCGRLMANVSTYMLLDDHEITDDWNLNFAWSRSVRQSELGIDTVRNGILAYWSFQDLGNRIDSGKDPLLAPAQKFFTESGRNKSAVLAVDASLRSRSWSFVAPTNPRVVFLDTRTKRALSTIETIKAVGGEGETSVAVASDTQLVSSDEIDRLIAQIQDSRTPAAVLVTPSPLFSVIAIDSLKSQLVKLPAGERIPAAFADVEHWFLNPSSFFEGCRLLDALKTEQVFVISGDVHFSFAMSLNLSVKDRKFHVAQMTSSALLNEHPPMLKAALEIAGLRWSSSKESQAWWMPIASTEAIVFDNFLGAQAAYEATKAKLGPPSLEFVTQLEPLHEQLPSLISLRPPSRSIETRNTVGTLEFFGDLVESRFLSSLAGRPVRSRTLQFKRSDRGL